MSIVFCIGSQCEKDPVDEHQGAESFDQSVAVEGSGELAPGPGKEAIFSTFVAKIEKSTLTIEKRKFHLGPHRYRMPESISLVK